MVTFVLTVTTLVIIIKNVTKMVTKSSLKHIKKPRTSYKLMSSFKVDELKGLLHSLANSAGEMYKESECKKC